MPARGYYAVAHRAGNNLHHLEQALDAGVDAIECDFWHDHGRLSLRHERKLPALPVLYDRWYLRFSFGDELNLRDLLNEINFRAELFLDIKSTTTLAADAVLELYHDHEAMMPPTRVTSRQWSLLDRVVQAETRLQTFYSIGRTAGIEALLRRVHDPLRPTGTSIRHTLLNADVVRRLHDAGLLVYAWTVNNRRRAADLLAWGVDGIISDDTALFAEIERYYGPPAR
jgi:glycerophosphoryl diester phosphodiesterase